VTHVIGLPYHWGPAGIVTGDIVNDLIGIALEPNVKIHEAKALTCDLRKGPRTRGVSASEQRQPHADLSQGGAVDRTRSEGEEMLHNSPLAGLPL
jgi:formate dehydrogenase major subunit